MKRIDTGSAENSVAIIPAMNTVVVVAAIDLIGLGSAIDIVIPTPPKIVSMP